MYYSRATIDNLLGEHAAIRGHLELVTNLTQEWKILLSTDTNLLMSRERRQEIAEKRQNLVQAMAYLEDGLKNHHIHENEVMPSLLGDLLMKSIRLQHEEMLRFFDKIDAYLMNPSLEIFLHHGMEIMQLIDDLSSYARIHSSREDGILYLLKNLPELKS